MKNKTKILANLALITQIGFTVVLMLIACIFIGKYLDDKFGTKVLFLIIFTILGVLSAFNYIFKIGLKGIGSSRNTTVNYNKKETKELSKENRYKEYLKKKEKLEKYKKLKDKKKEG